MLREQALRIGGCGMSIARAIVLFAGGVAVLALAGCGHIAIHTDAALKSGKTGILYYPPKPYVLISRTGAKDKPNEVQVIYLPDLSQPRYAVMRAGYGSSKLGLTFSNGLLVSANQETDPKITEAITALANIPGALATAAKTRAETDNLRAEASDFPAIAQVLRSLAADLEQLLGTTEAAHAFTPSDRAALQRLPAALTSAADALIRPDLVDPAPVIQAVTAVQTQLNAIAPIAASDLTDADKTQWAHLAQIKSRLASALANLKPKPAEVPTVSLYEVLMDAQGTRLREVPLDTLGQ